jgi:hypothetical protein
METFVYIPKTGPPYSPASSYAYDWIIPIKVSSLKAIYFTFTNPTYNGMDVYLAQDYWYTTKNALIKADLYDAFLSINKITGIMSTEV